MSEIPGAFWIILTGALAAASCGLLGTFLVLRRMSMLGDALSHAVLPGIAMAFFLSGSRSVLPMFLGAAIAGLLTTVLVEAFHRRWRVQEDASIGIVFTAFFALGVVMISAYAGQVDLDQECVLYGEIAYTPWDMLVWKGEPVGPRPVWILGGMLLVNLLLVGLCYKELVISSFDPAMAAAVGINAAVVHYVLMGAVSLTTVAAFESVGAILVVALLIVPGAAAYLWSDRLPVILGLAVGFGVAAAAGGYYLASLWDSSIAGAMVVVLGAVFALSLLLAPNQGLLSRLGQRWNLSLRMAQDHMLLGLVRWAEGRRETRWSQAEMREAGSVPTWLRGLAFRQLRRQGMVEGGRGGFQLTQAGKAQALRLLRGHRLWETYLNRLGLPEDHVHAAADAVEHFLDDQLRQELSAQVAGAQVDPQGKRIPDPETRPSGDATLRS